MRGPYFSNPRRRRNSAAEMVPSLLARCLDFSMILKNFRLVPSASVSSSVLRIGMTAAKGRPAL